MLVFATSDKGGTGRSVTSANIVYQAASDGANACYLDFDFGSPTAGAIFQISDKSRGTPNRDGLHTYLFDDGPNPVAVNVWEQTNRPELRRRPRNSGRLVLYPGDEGGSEFSSNPAIVERCARLFRRLDEQFDLCLVDLSAGRSFATDIVLQATRTPDLVHTDARWLIFHRWTRQHIIAANGLVYGDNGILANAEEHGHDPAKFKRNLRFVRTAYVDPEAEALQGLRSGQISWLHKFDQELTALAGKNRLGQTTTLGTVPLDPLLQWREQLILEDDTHKLVANEQTVKAFIDLAMQVRKDVWEAL
ncbi:SCO2523 family variant P-loop protein [Cryptosporangium phraense]|uniref:ParA family protein n=1 Tax=Cryptosporangium phraense TaxID=2593070 RepID=A0A545AW39_9ACTN|nr:SCO2523 family variant P-loop protein [Cryptosporangium phraense]TQS45540.1 ParA family protein [Cryptosporangium phraense]